MTSTSETAASGLAVEFVMVAGADEGDPAKFSSPRSSVARSMATLLTLVETPFGAESCAFSEAGGTAEVLSRESVTGRSSGVSGGGMKGRHKKATGSGESGQEEMDGEKQVVAFPALISWELNQYHSRQGF